MSKRPKRFFAGDEVSDYDSGEGRGSAGTSETITPSKPKPKIVTKEELAASGLSLRDYMNKQQGLTRRGEPSTASTKSEPSSRQQTAPEDADMQKKKAAFERALVQQQADKTVSDWKKRGSPLKAGGKVSASSRADGIATKGKTRGRMC
jgi:hypothetical protein